MDKGGDEKGEEGEALVGFPMMGKALDQLAVKAIYGLGQILLNAVFWFGDLDKKIDDAAMWAMGQILEEVGLVEEMVAETIWDTLVQSIPSTLRALTCHFGTTMVEAEVPPYDQFEIMNLKNSWGELWKENTTF